MNTHYKKIVKEYTNWLKALKYSPKTIYSSSNTLKLIVDYLEKKEIKSLKQLTKQQIDEYINQLQKTKSSRTKKQLSNVHINSYISVLIKLNTFVHLNYNYTIPIHHLQLLKVNNKQRNILTIKQINELFEVTKNDKIGLRDKVMLSLYYSCGLRRNEAIHIQLNDIDLYRQQLHIKVSKFGKERTVPLTNKTVKYIKEYLKNGRPLLQNRKKRVRKYLLLSERGKQITTQSLSLRLKKLLKKANINKHITLHSLRHSIATHLLEKGMEIEDISTFLGHSTLESTQIYTHINNENP